MDMKVTSFAQAREIALEYLRATWGGPGTPWTSQLGLEDDEGYLVQYGAKEFLVDGDPAFQIMESSCLLVDRHVGLVEHQNVNVIFDRIDAMTRVRDDS